MRSELEKIIAIGTAKLLEIRPASEDGELAPPTPPGSPSAQVPASSGVPASTTGAVPASAAPTTNKWPLVPFHRLPRSSQALMAVPLSVFPMSREAKAWTLRQGATSLGDLLVLPEVVLREDGLAPEVISELESLPAGLALGFGMRIPGWQFGRTAAAVTRAFDPAVCRWIRAIRYPDEPITLEDELSDLTRHLGSEGLRRFLIEWLGWDGAAAWETRSEDEAEGSTSEGRGSSEGRVEEPTNRVEKLKKIGGLTVPLEELEAHVRRLRVLPLAFSKVLFELRAIRLEPVEEFERRMYVAGLTRGHARADARTAVGPRPFRIEGMLEAARMFRIPALPRIRRFGPHRILVGRGMATRGIAGVWERARELSSRRGLASLSEFCFDDSDRFDRRVHDVDIARLLEADPAFEWLDGEWFRFRPEPAAPNAPQGCPLLERLRRILCVSGRIDVAPLREAILRSGLAVCAPDSVLLEICRRTPWIEVRRSSVLPAAALDWRKVYTRRAERVVIQTLFRRGPLVSRRALERSCKRAGVSAYGLGQVLIESPVIVRVMRGIYRLVGSEVAAEEWADLRRRARWRAMRRLGRAQAGLDDPWRPRTRGSEPAPKRGPNRRGGPA